MIFFYLRTLSLGILNKVSVTYRLCLYIILKMSIILARECVCTWAAGIAKVKIVSVI